jgi:hypothetical protein
MRYHVTKVDYRVKALCAPRKAAVQQLLSSGAPHADRIVPHAKRWNMSRGMSGVRGEVVRVARETGHMQLMSFARDADAMASPVGTESPPTVLCVTVPRDTLRLSNGWVPEAVMSLRSVACLLFRETYGTYVGLRFQVDNDWHYDMAPFSIASMSAA